MSHGTLVLTYQVSHKLICACLFLSYSQLQSFFSQSQDRHIVEVSLFFRGLPKTLLKVFCNMVNYTIPFYYNSLKLLR